MGSFSLGYCYNTLHYTLLRYGYLTCCHYYFCHSKDKLFFKQKIQPEMCIFSAAYLGPNRLRRSEIKAFLRMFKS